MGTLISLHTVRGCCISLPDGCSVVKVHGSKALTVRKLGIQFIFLQFVRKFLMQGCARSESTWQSTSLSAIYGKLGALNWKLLFFHWNTKVLGSSYFFEMSSQPMRVSAWSADWKIWPKLVLLWKILKCCEKTRFRYIFWWYVAVWQSMWISRKPIKQQNCGQFLDRSFAL